MAVDVDAELKRRNSTGGLVDWLLVADTENTVSALSDPSIEYGVRSRLGALSTSAWTTGSGSVIGVLKGIYGRLGAPLSVALTSGSLAALEAVTVSGTVALTSGSLAALESVTVTGTVALTSGSLAALESVTVVDGGGSLTVDDGGTTLSVDDGGGSLTVDGPLTDAELRATDVDVLMGQTSEVTVVTSASASPGSPYKEPWTATGAAGVVRVLTLVISPTDSANGGTFTFEFDDTNNDALALGDSSINVSESRVIGDFDTLRDFDLHNNGAAYYRWGYEPASALGAETVVVATTYSRQYDGPFVRLANQEIEEANAAMGQQFAYLKAFDAITGKSVNLRPTAQGDLRVSDARLTVTESGSLDTESVRDDVSISFSRDSGAASVSSLLTDLSAGGTVSHDATEGQLLLTTTATSGRVSYVESVLAAQYEPGHMIRGDMTVQVSALPAGTAKIEWGWGEDNGSNDLLNAMGWGLDATGLYTFRKKAGSYASKVYQPDFNMDMLSGNTGSFYRDVDGPVVFDPLTNRYYVVEYEWLGSAPPRFKVMAPLGRIIPAHVEDSTLLASTTVPEPELSMFIRVANGDQSVNYQVRSGSWRGGLYTSTLVDRLAAGTTSQQSVTTSAVALSTPLLRRRTIRLKNMSVSARAMHYGFSSSVTNSSGDELAPGESVEIDLDASQNIWVITTSTAGAGVRCSVAELR